MVNNKLNNDNIKLCYFGGAGGFLLLHLILLSKKFYCQFDAAEKTLEQIIDKQWQISDPRFWKTNECWPDNSKTFDAHTNLRKIYFFCNPVIDHVNKFDGKIVFLYLDATAHIKMAEYKHAYVFFNESTSLYQNFVSYYRAKIKKWQTHYNNIKDPTWPKCLGPSAFNRLPYQIQKELLDNPYTLSTLKIKKYVAGIDDNERNKKMQMFLSKKVMTIDGVEVMPQVRDFLPYADLSFHLSDIVNNLAMLSTITKSSINQDQLALLTKWKLLHPSSLLNSIGIKTDQNRI